MNAREELDAVKQEIYPILVAGGTERAVFIAKVKLSLTLSEAQQWVAAYSHESERTVMLIVQYMAFHIKKKAFPDGESERQMQKIWDDADAFERRQIDTAFARLLVLESDATPLKEILK